MSPPSAPIRLPATRDRAVLLESRDPRGATLRISTTGYGDLPQLDRWNAEQAFRLGVLSNVVAYRCVQLRANAGSSVPLVAGRRLGDAKTINESSPLARLLGPPPGGPAPKLSARKLLRWTFAQQIVTGRRAWEIESDGGPPVAFWPLAASSLRAVPSKGGTEWFTKFLYGSHHDPTRFKPEDVFYGWDPSGTDFRQAESGLQASRYNLTLITMSDRYGISFLRNNAVPAAIITTTAFPDDATRQAFRRQWASEFEGVDNAGRFYHNEVEPGDDGKVEGTIDVKQLGVTAKDARLIEMRKEAMVELAISLGVPWSKLDASGRTFDNADAEERTFMEETVLPDMIDLQDDINMQIAPRFGDEVVWFDLRGVKALQRRVIPVSQPVGAPELLQARIWKIDEARVDMGQEPLPNGEGDRFLTDEEVLLLTSPASSAAARENAPEPPPQLPPAPLALPPAPVEDDDERARPTEHRAVDPELVEQRRARVWRTTDATARQLEARWQRAFARLFSRQADATVTRLTGKRGRQATQRAAGDPIDVNAIFDPAFWAAETGELVDGLYEDVATAGLARLTLAYAIDFDLAAPFVREFIEARVNQLAGPVTTTTYEAIQAAMVAGVEAGESVDELAARIRQVFTVASQGRAETIARTEVISAYNGAASLGASQLPADVVAAQEWIATRDGRTREEHADADGQTVAIGEPFTVAGRAMAYPGDPAGGAAMTVNCRCTVAFLTPEELAELTERGAVKVEHRAARVALRTVRVNDAEFDVLRFRRALEGAAA